MPAPPARSPVRRIRSRVAKTGSANRAMRSAMASFLEHAQDDQPKAEAHSRPAPALGPLDLRQEVLRSHDRPGDQVREEQDEQHEVAEVPLRLDPAAIDVDGVVDRFESVERDADRQNHAQHRQRGRRPELLQGVAQRVEKEIGVLEDGENAQIHQQAKPEKQLAPPRRAGRLPCRGQSGSPEPW